MPYTTLFHTFERLKDNCDDEGWKKYKELIILRLMTLHKTFGHSV
jgi:hypothetical protein